MYIQKCIYSSIYNFNGGGVAVCGRAAPFYVGWSGSGGGGCSNASNAPYAQSADFKIYNT